MAYTSPRQWLDLLRRSPGSRFTDLGPAANVLDATGDFTQRSSANPGRDWRSIMAEGEQRRQQSASYGTPGSAISQPGMPGSSSGSQPTARRESYTDILANVPGSAVRDPVRGYEETYGATGTGPGDPQSFLGKVGSFFTKPGIAEMMITGGAAMSQAASQPGASVWGSLGAGGEAGVKQYNLMQQQQAVRDRLTAESTATGLETATEAQELEQRKAILNSWLDAAEIVDPAERARYAPFAVSDDTLQMARDDLGLTDDPTTLEELQDKFTWFETLSPEQQASLNYMQRNPPAAGTTINTGDTPQDPAEEAMGEWVQNLYGMRQTIENQTLPGIDNLDQTLAMVNDPRFGEISGVLRGNAAADVVARVQGDPHLLGMIGAFERLGQTRTLQILANFTGAKSNYELDMARKMAQGDRSMSPDEMRAALNLMRRAYIQDAVRWARDIQGLAPIEGAFADVDAGFRSRSQSILDQYGEEERSYYQAVDPFGIGNGPGLR